MPPGGSSALEGGASEAVFPEARILVVGDESSDLPLLEDLLRRWGYRKTMITSDSSELLALCAELRPDLILLDVQPPKPGDRFPPLEQLAPLTTGGTYLPIIVLSAEITEAARKRALAKGAKDFITKPIQPAEASLRVRNLLETRRVHREVAAHTRVLEERVRARTRELEVVRLEFIQCLALAAEHRDEDGREHAQRVGRTAALLAQELGLAEEVVRLIRWTAPLHDIGNIAIPDAVLLKPGKLTREEFELMKTHTVIGSEILSGGTSRHLQMAELIARSHHERWDGAGYPDGLAGHAIPLPARLTGLADAFDALTRRRPHKEVSRLGDAVAEMERQSGEQFDPDVVRAFRSLDHKALLAPVKLPPVRAAV